ncbi:cell envelope integrity TolA C-terminal domain-containing protein [Pseudaeromonas sp. ZJS20]|uniref:cell envelope integrity TolA C-terminal domain-containing protein n=1 Tax=Pseudaeromonas aegiceratis TaxID=3153928 RepID=UPI00390CA3A2
MKNTTGWMAILLLSSGALAATDSAKRDEQLMQQYVSKVSKALEKHFQADASLAGQHCELQLRLEPDGLVVAAAQTAGDNSLCVASLNGFKKMKKLPLPPAELSEQIQSINLTLEP